MTLKRRLLLASPLVLVLALGCDKSNPNAPASVSGKVTYNGSPVTGGTVTFQPKEGPVYAGHMGDDGSYTITDMPVGDFTVSVETESVNPDAKKATYGPKGQAAAPAAPAEAPKPGSSTGGAPAVAAGKYVKIPAKYTVPETSGLTATIVAGKQTKNFELKD